MRSFSCEGNSCEHVHNQVDPKKLNDDERRVAEDDSSDEYEGHAGDIHGHLELNEFANVVLEVAAPTDGSDDCEEVIVHEDDVSVILGSGAAILTKGEANISFRESTSIAKTLTSDTDGRTGLAESASKHMFELWGSSVDEKDVFLDFSAESLFALFVDEDVSLATAFFMIVFFLHKWFKSSEEFIRRDSLLVFLLLNKSNLNSGLYNRCFVVTRDKSHIGSSLNKLLNSFADSLAKRIRETNGGEKSQLRLNQIARRLILKVVVCLLHGFEFIKIKVTVRESESL